MQIGILLSGSLLGACETAILECSVSRDEYRETRCLPDWMSCDPEQREQLKEVVVGKVLPSTSAVGMRKISTPLGVTKDTASLLRELVLTF